MCSPDRFRWKTRTAQRRIFRSGLAKRLAHERTFRSTLLKCEKRSANLPKMFCRCLAAEHSPEAAAAVDWLKEECGLDQAGAEQAVEYIVAGRAVLRAVPTQQTVIAERFFDESGGMQLVIHAPFGGRINKAWGLALRKRFCRSFNFELQAAATDNGLNISLSDQHSFPLADVFRFSAIRKRGRTSGASGA